MNHTTELLNEYLKAAKAVLQAGLEQMRAEDPEGFHDVSAQAYAGGMFRLETSMSTAGLFELNVCLVSATGESIQLMHSETGVVNH